MLSANVTLTALYVCWIQVIAMAEGFVSRGFMSAGRALIIIEAHPALTGTSLPEESLLDALLAASGDVWYGRVPSCAALRVWVGMWFGVMQFQAVTAVCHGNESSCGVVKLYSSPNLN